MSMWFIFGPPNLNVKLLLQEICYRKTLAIMPRVVEIRLY